MPPWFENERFPLYLAPMAGVTDLVFRSLCKEFGADVMVTEFVSAEGILQADERTRRYTEFTEAQRPVGVQLFGADGGRMAEAARKIIDWKQPDFIDLNFGCPVNKVVSRNGGSSLLKDCPTLAKVAETVASRVPIPVTAKIRIGWDKSAVNAVEVTRTLEDTGIAAVAVHGRTRSQGYSGEADWEVIAKCADAVKIPVIGNGDIRSGHDVAMRRGTAGVLAVMIGRAAMCNPRVFREARHFLDTGHELPPATLGEHWELILRHTRMAIDWGRYGGELHTMRNMRSRLMAYSRGLPGGKALRTKFSLVTSVAELEEIRDRHLADHTSDVPTRVNYTWERR